MLLIYFSAITSPVWTFHDWLSIHYGLVKIIVNFVQRIKTRPDQFHTVSPELAKPNQRLLYLVDRKSPVVNNVNGCIRGQGFDWNTGARFDPSNRTFLSLDRLDVLEQCPCSLCTSYHSKTFSRGKRGPPGKLKKRRYINRKKQAVWLKCRLIVLLTPAAISRLSRGAALILEWNENAGLPGRNVCGILIGVSLIAVSRQDCTMWLL